MLSWQDEARLHWPSLSKQGKVLFDYLLTHECELADFTLHDCSVASGVGEATICRTLQKLGYPGWNRFKQAIWQSSPAKRITPRPTRLQDIPSHITQRNVELMANCAVQLDPVTLREAIRLIRRAKTIAVYGSEESSAGALAGRLLHLGFSCSHYRDIYYQKISATNVDGGDLAIAISQSGETVNILSCMESARQNGAPTIAITADEDSSLAHMAGLVILSPAPDAVDELRWIRTRITEYLLIDILVNALLLQDEGARKRSLQKAEIQYAADLFPKAE